MNAIQKAGCVSIILLGSGLFALSQGINNPQTNASALTTGTLACARTPAFTGNVTTSAGSCATTLAAGNAGNLDSGTLLAARMPALTGDVTTSAGAVATTLAAGSASNLNSGTLAAARGGAGTINGALKGNGSGTVSQAACADLSNGTGACSATYTAPASWTPADGSGAALTFTNVSANYTQIGNMVFAYANLTYPSTADGTGAKLSGFPVTFANANYSRQCMVNETTVTSGNLRMNPVINTTTANLTDAVDSQITNATMSLKFMQFICIYPAT